MAFRESTARAVLDRWGGLAVEVSANPPLLLAFVAQESSGDQFAARNEPGVSDQSRGLAQVLTGTLAQMQTEGRVPREWTPDDLWNPQINLQVAEAIIRRQIVWWSGDLPRAVASYNAGINYREIDPRTRARPGYVDSVLAYYRWFLDHWNPSPPPEISPESSGPSVNPQSPGAGTDGSPTPAGLLSAGAFAMALVLAAVFGSR